MKRKMRNKKNHVQVIISADDHYWLEEVLERAEELVALLKSKNTDKEMKIARQECLQELEFAIARFYDK